MQDRPTAEELSATLNEFLVGEVLPNVAGTLRYHTLVAANLTKILAREAVLYPAAALRERAELCRLLGVVASGEATEQLPSLNAQLARRLREGSWPAAGAVDAAFERASWQLLSTTVAAKLAINKPGYDRYDVADEVSS